MLSLGNFFRTETCIHVHWSVLMFCLVLVFDVVVLVVVDVRENEVYVNIDIVVIRVAVVDIVDQLVKRMVFAVLSGKIGLVSRKILLGRGRSTLADPW